MKEYVKINTLFKRDMANKGRIIEGEWACPEFGYLKNNEWVFTEKVNGTNVRISAVIPASRLWIGGRTNEAQIPVVLLDAIHGLLTFDSLASVFSKDDLPIVTLYGEGYGSKIQSGGKYRPDTGFVLFDVLVGGVWLERHNVEDVAGKLGLNVVPIRASGTLADAIELTRIGIKSAWGDFMAEGIVMRPSVELRTRLGHRVIAKIKHRDFVR